MGEPSRRALELNEVEWWSRWARLDWLDGNTHILTSRKFHEPFFNRAGFLACRGIPNSLSSIESRFRVMGLRSNILIGEDCTEGLNFLRRAGYRLVDSMSVLELTTPSFNPNESLEVRRVGGQEVEGWSKAYLLSFYGSTRLLPEVGEVIGRIRSDRSVVLFEGKLGGHVAGVLAVYRRRALAGVYCVGTIPRFRRMGIAGTLITKANEIAEGEGRRLILQTLESDRAETFYLRGGFRRLYSKKILTRSLKGRRRA